MRKIIFAVAIICCSYYAQAQFRIGVTSGLGGSYMSKFKPTGNMSNSSKTDNYLQGHKVSYYAGITGDWQLSRHFSLQPSLLYISKGGSSGVKWAQVLPDQVSSMQTEGNVRMNYVELPLNLVYKQKFGAGYAFAGAGAYAARYLDGHKEGAFMTREYPERVLTPITENIPPVYTGRRGPYYPNAQADAKLWDAGINFTTGYEFPFKLQLALNYSLGLNETYYGKNRSYSLSIAYYLHK